MHILGFILAAVMIGVLLFTAFWVGVFLLAAAVLGVTIEAIYAKLTGRVNRWQFIREARVRERHSSGQVIEGEYKDITHQ
jgi:membrane protein implicated in regulation of membrane protease activity